MEIGTEQATLPEPSLREQLAENLRAADTGETAPVVEREASATETETEKAWRLANRLRDDTGKLLPGVKEPAAQGGQPAKSAQPATEARPVAVRPSSWKKEHWQDWDKLAVENPALAAYLNQREGEYAKGVSTYKQEWEQAKPLIDAIAPFQPILQQHGMDPAKWVSNLGNAHYKLSMGSQQDKVAMFQKLAQDYRVPVQLAIQGQDGNWQLLGQQQFAQQQPQQNQFDPSTIPRLVQQELQAASTKNALAAFTADAPTKYPHFEAVKQTMAGLLQAGLADDLPSAYDAALRHPRHADIFAQVQEQQRATDDAAAKEAQRAKVTRARTNAVSTASATPSARMNTSEDKGLRATIAEQFDAVAGGRV